MYCALELPLATSMNTCHFRFHEKANLHFCRHYVSDFSDGRESSIAQRGQQENAEADRAYFNSITTLQARFLQVASTGAMTQGTLSLKRPGRMRFEYDAPSPILLVSNGTWLVFQDNELEQTTHVPLGSTPLSVLVEDPVDLETDIEVLDVTTESRCHPLIDADAGRSEAGPGADGFFAFPACAATMGHNRCQGVEVKVALLETRRGMALKNDLFKPQDFKGNTFND